MTKAVRPPRVLYVAPAVVGLGVAGLVLLLAAFVVRATGDMVVVVDQAAPVQTPDAAGDPCGDPFARGWELFCAKDGDGRCTVALAEDCSVWVKTGSGCWLPQTDVSFHDANTRLGEPIGARIGDGLDDAARAACAARDTAREEAALAAVEKLGDEQRWVAVLGAAERSNSIIKSDGGRAALAKVVLAARQGVENIKLTELEAICDQRKWNSVIGQAAQLRGTDVLVTDAGRQRTRAVEERAKTAIRIEKAAVQLDDAEGELQVVGEQVTALSNRVHAYDLSAELAAELLPLGDAHSQRLTELTADVAKLPAENASQVLRRSKLESTRAQLKSQVIELIGLIGVKRYAHCLFSERKAQRDALEALVTPNCDAPPDDVSSRVCSWQWKNRAFKIKKAFRKCKLRTTDAVVTDKTVSAKVHLNCTDIVRPPFTLWFKRQAGVLMPTTAWPSPE